MTNHQPLREQLLHYAKMLNDSGLSVGKSGNISMRCQNGLLITPSGQDYHQLSANDLVWIDYQGNSHNDPLRPSSEWYFHSHLYQHRCEINAIVHTHATYCTALACTGKSIPAFHYMVAIAGGIDIPLAPYSLFGTEQLSNDVVKTLHQRSACLLANHGMVALGDTLDETFKLSIEVENLAKQYCIALQLGEVKLLSESQMAHVLEKFQSYGQRL